MTFAEIQTKVASRLNLTSAAAISRIGEEINERYREIMSSCGLSTIAIGTATAATAIGSRNVTFTAEKLFTVYNANFTPPIILAEKSFTELRQGLQGTDPARQFAFQLIGASTVTIYLNSPAATIYTLTADAEINIVDLSGAQVPAFSASYHDIIMRGVYADELYKMEKYSLSTEQEKKFEKRLAELKYFVNKSAWRDEYQGKTGRGTRSANPVWGGS